MTVTKEIVPIEGMLSGEGRERKCRVKALQHATYANEDTSPTCLSYSRLEIEDQDEFPDGEYVLEFGERRIPLIRQSGRYFPRCA